MGQWKQWLGCAAAVVGLVLTGAAARGESRIAVNGDGSVIITTIGRVMYEHDPATLKVIKRTRMDQNIKDLVLSSDGKLLFENQGPFDGAMNVRERVSGKIVRTVEKAGDFGGFGGWTRTFVTNLAADLVAFRQGEKLMVLSMKDGTDVATIPVPKEKAHIGAISPDGKRLMILTKAVDNDEKKEEAAPDVRTKEDPEFKAKHDGKGSVLYLYELPSGKELQRQPLWISAEGYMSGMIGFDGKEVLFLTYNGLGARITPEGSITLLKGLPMGYGFGVAADGRKFATGSLVDNGVVAASLESAPQKIQAVKANPGWPEYYRGFVFDLKGRVYGVTDAERVFKLDEAQKMGPIEPIY